MSNYYDEQEKRRKRWPWGDLEVTDAEVTQDDSGEWIVRTTWPNGTVYTTKCRDEQGAHAYALMQQRGIYRSEHEPAKYDGRFPVLYVEPDAATEWDWIVAMIPVPTMGGTQAGGYLVIDQSVHPNGYRMEARG